ncbi:hypothetical protein D3C73_1490910 [compost metagenome]
MSTASWLEMLLSAMAACTAAMMPSARVMARSTASMAFLAGWALSSAAMSFRLLKVARMSTWRSTTEPSMRVMWLLLPSKKVLPMSCIWMVRPRPDGPW